MLILWNFEPASFNSFSRYFFPSLVAHFSVVGFGGCGFLHWVVCALSTEGSLTPEDDDGFDGCFRWFVFALSTEGRLAPEDDDCEGPLLLLHRRLVGVEEEWLVCRLYSSEAIFGEVLSLVGRVGAGAGAFFISRDWRQAG